MIQDSHFFPRTFWGVSIPNENLWFHEIAPWKYKTLKKLAAENSNLLLIVLSYFVGSRITYPNQCQSHDLFILFMNYSVFEKQRDNGLYGDCFLVLQMAAITKRCNNKKTLNDTCTTTQKWTNNSFHNTKKHFKYDYFSQFATFECNNIGSHKSIKK